MAETMKTWRFDGLVELLAPLSHIGESLGPDSYLAESTILDERGQRQTCFVYSGNSFRGLFRDLGAMYLLNRLGMKLPLEQFYLLFSGGQISGPQSVDMEQARLYRRVLPLFSIFGGGTVKQIIHGKLNIGALYPLVRECQRTLPARLRRADAPAWRSWTMEQSFTRIDDAKNEDYRDRYLRLPPGETQQMALTGEAAAAGEPVAGKAGRPQQMRYSVELLAPGSLLYQRIDTHPVTELELGAFVSCFSEFSKIPYLGGMNRIGMGLAQGRWDIVERDGSTRTFLAVGQDVFSPGAEAAAALESYDQFLLEAYNRYLDGKATELKQLLGAAGNEAP